MEYLTIDQGVHNTLDIDVLDTNGQPYDLDGAYIYFTVKRYRSDSDYYSVIAKDNALLGGITTSAYGAAVIVLDPEDTADIANVGPRHKFYYDVQVEKNSEPSVVDKGYLTIEPVVRKGD